MVRRLAKDGVVAQNEGDRGGSETKAPRSAILGISALLILSTGYFAGFATYVPVQRFRSQLRSTRRREADERRMADRVNAIAPPIVSQTLEGRQWRLASQKGKVVVAFFWSILCEDCVKVIPEIDRIHARFGGRDDFVLVGVHRYPQRDVISCYCSAKGISWPQLYEDAEASKHGFVDALGISRTPSICIIDKQGTVRVIRAGLGDIESEILRLL